jgi:tetratricopeptide (TPR) repeat protein
VLVSDGVATAGATKADALVAAAKALGDQGVTRLDAVLVGGIRDEASLKRLVTSGLSRPGVVIDGDQGADVVVRKLGQRAERDLAVRVEGASWWWPERIDNAQPGDEVLVYAEVSPGQPVRVSVGESTPVTPRLVRTEPTLLSRAVVRARIAGLEDQAAKQGDSESVVQTIVDLSTQNRVLSKYTALLVLETEADYARFKIDRTALADILTVRDGAVAVIDRRTKKDQKNPFDELDKANGKPKGDVPPAPVARDRAAPSEPPPPATAAPDTDRGNMWGADIGDAFGAGGLGLSGIGEGGGGPGDGIGLGSIGTIGHGAGTGSGQGFGSGHGRLGGDHRTRPPSIRMGATQVTGRLPPEVIQRIVRQNFGRFRLCYENGLRENPNLQGLVQTRFVIGRDGAVASVVNSGSDLPNAAVVNCIVRGFSGLSFPEPEGGIVTVVYPIHLAPGDSSPSPSVASRPEEPMPKTKPYTGRFEVVMKAIEEKQPARAMTEAIAWRTAEPGDVLALVALGEAYEAQGDDVNAARAYGSLIDLFPSRADLRRFAGGRLERIKGTSALELAVDTYRQAVEQRPDHPASHRMLAMSLVRKGAYSEAFDVIAAGAQRSYPPGRFAGAPQILAEDVGLVAAAWIQAEPARRDEVLAKVTAAHGKVEDAPSLRFIVTWETDANDLDFHIRDASGGHAYYGDKSLPNDGGRLYADVTTGYGPECFTIRQPREKRSASYSMQAHYFSRGPMGYGMGKLSIIDHDGKGKLTFEERPFVVMVDHAFVDLGTVKR